MINAAFRDPNKDASVSDTLLLWIFGININSSSALDPEARRICHPDVHCGYFAASTLSESWTVVIPIESQLQVHLAWNFCFP